MSESTLVLVHVIFRHGNRTPELTYPNDPHKDATFDPTGRGHLTIEGKKKAYALGRILRERYDAFLGTKYRSDILDPWTSDSDRTKMSLQIVLASLFPPVADERFEETLNWQPIPYKYVKFTDDDMFLPSIRRETLEAYKEHVASAECATSLKTHEEIFKRLSDHTGSNIKSPKDVMLLYGVLKVQEEFGLELPPWTVDYWPEQIQALAIEEFRISNGTPKLQKLMLGKLLTKIVDDTTSKLEGKSNCKMHLYSAHDVNIGALLSFFEIPFDLYPPYSCFLIFEVHKIEDVFVVKMFYHDYSTPEPKAVNFKNGFDFLSFENFKRVTEELYARE